MVNAAIKAVRKATNVFAQVELHLLRRGVALPRMVSGGGQQNTFFVGSRGSRKPFVFQLDMTIDGRSTTAGSRVRITLTFEESGAKFYSFMSRYRVYYDAKRNEWRLDNGYLADIPSALRISDKLPKGRLTQKQALRVVDILADHFMAQVATKPHASAQA